MRFTVLDAGEPVRGARVKVGGRSGTTDGSGSVKLTLTLDGALTARATRGGYTTAIKPLEVRR